MFKKVAHFGILAQMLHIANFSSEFLIHVSAQNLTGVWGLKKRCAAAVVTKNALIKNRTLSAQL